MSALRSMYLRIRWPWSSWMSITGGGAGTCIFNKLPRDSGKCWSLGTTAWEHVSWREYKENWVINRCLMRVSSQELGAQSLWSPPWWAEHSLHIFIYETVDWGVCLLHPDAGERFRTTESKWKWSRSVVFDSATPWTVAYQAPLSMGFSRQ